MAHNDRVWSSMAHNDDRVWHTMMVSTQLYSVHISLRVSRVYPAGCWRGWSSWSPCQTGVAAPRRTCRAGGRRPIRRRTAAAGPPPGTGTGHRAQTEHRGHRGRPLDRLLVLALGTEHRLSTGRAQRAAAGPPPGTGTGHRAQTEHRGHREGTEGGHWTASWYWHWAQSTDWAQRAQGGHREGGRWSASWYWHWAQSTDWAQKAQRGRPLVRLLVLALSAEHRLSTQTEHRLRTHTASTHCQLADDVLQLRCTFSIVITLLLPPIVLVFTSFTIRLKFLKGKDKRNNPIPIGIIAWRSE